MEATKAVAPEPWHHMDVKVRHALADSIVHRDEGPVRAHAFLDRAREQLDVPEQRSNELRRQISQRADVLTWDEQTVAEKDGAPVEKRHVRVALEHPRLRGHRREEASVLMLVFREPRPSATCRCEVP